MLAKGGPIIQESIRRILIIQLGDIGDIVWTTPAIRALKASYTEATIRLLVRRGFGGLLDGDSMIESVLEAGSSGSFGAAFSEALFFISSLRQGKFDMAVDLRAGDRGAVAARLTGAPVRVALYYDRDVSWWRNALFTHLVDPASPARWDLGAAEQSLRIVREIGAVEDDGAPRLWVSDSCRESAAAILRRRVSAPPERFITVNPFSRWAYKEWVDERWGSLIGRIDEELGLATVIIGSPGEAARGEKILSHCGDRALNMAGQTTLAELKGLLSMSLLHLGVDSAAPHIAAALGTPTVTIYGPTDWRHWAPKGLRRRVIVPSDSCAPCNQKGCASGGVSRCLSELTVDRVFFDVADALRGLTVETNRREGI
ncbi:MAG: glycosyltransferase family 9 protein [Deltaproteobacteria bacterium]|nr:glycosyltransferase family 9 protein [Deltaproteobacteria bacterium]